VYSFFLLYDSINNFVNYALFHENGYFYLSTRVEITKRVTKSQYDEILKSLRSELRNLNQKREEKMNDLSRLDDQNSWIDLIDEFTRKVDVSLNEEGECNYVEA
jgi:hypothetical protein|tara:strand:+ start:265 stop:576 length:312 start_codon:yes stop_codon:yes gene_type:complete